MFRCATPQVALNAAGSYTASPGKGYKREKEYYGWHSAFGVVKAVTIQGEAVTAALDYCSSNLLRRIRNGLLKQ